MPRPEKSLIIFPACQEASNPTPTYSRHQANSGITTVDGLVASWTDANGIYTASQNTAVNRPTFNANSVGPYPGVGLGDNKSLQFLSQSHFTHLHDGSPWTLFLVVRVAPSFPNAAAVQSIFTSRGGSALARGVNIQIGDGRIRYNCGNGTSNLSSPSLYQNSMPALPAGSGGKLIACAMTLDSDRRFTGIINLGLASKINMAAFNFVSGTTAQLPRLGPPIGAGNPNFLNTELFEFNTRTNALSEETCRYILRGLMDKYHIL